MFKVKVLNQEVLEEVLEMPAVIKGIEQVYTAKSQEKTALFPMVFHEFNPGVADMDIKSGHMKDHDIFGLKLVSWFGENKDKQLPLLIGTTMIFDANTGVPLAILNADHITDMRTGAAGAIGAKYLAKDNAKVLLMVGTGHIAQFEIAATLHAIDTIDRVIICDPMSHDHSIAYAEKLSEVLRSKFNITKALSIKALTLEDGVKESDIIITATPSRQAMIKKEWVQPGTHLSCVGADMSGKQEVDEALFKDSLIIVDDINQSIHVGETETAYKNNVIKEADLTEIGDVILSKHPGRKDQNQITLFDSTGIALQDLMTSKIALELADEKGLGQIIDLYGGRNEN